MPSYDISVIYDSEHAHKANYTHKPVARADNSFIDGWIQVTILGLKRGGGVEKLW